MNNSAESHNPSTATESIGNVLLVSDFPSDTKYAWWLMERFWLLLAEYFTAQRADVWLAFPEIASLSDGLQSSSISAIELDVRAGSLAQTSQLAKFVSEHNIKHIYFTDRPYFSILYGFLRLLGVKSVVVHDHAPGDRPDIDGFRGAIKAVRNRINLLTATAVISVSPLMQMRSVRNGRVPAEKTHTVQNGIYPVQCAGLDSGAIRRELGIPQDAIIVISTGRAHPYKRFDFIVDVAAVTLKKECDRSVFFLLVGDGPAFSELEAKILADKLQDRIFLLGFRSDVHALLCASDIAIHASLGEAFSLSIIEYMSAGMPVLVPDIPSVCQAIDDEIDGFIYPAYDVAIAAEMLSSIVADKHKRQQMAVNAKRKATQQYSMAGCEEQFSALIPKVFGVTKKGRLN